MKPFQTTGAATLVAAVFVGGWMCGQEFRASPAHAQIAPTQLDPNILAVTMGLASVAVDTEANALKLNEVIDRLSALERRVQELESARPR